MVDHIDDWPTRKQAADAIGVSPTTIRRLEETDQLHPVKDSNGCNRFNPTEVESLRVARASQPGGTPTAGSTPSLAAGALDGELAARIFEDLEGGMRPTDIVRERALNPHVVAAAVVAYRQLSELGGEAPHALARLGAVEEQVGRLWAHGQSLEQRIAAIEHFLYATQIHNRHV